MNKYKEKIFVAGGILFLFLLCGVGFYYVENYEEIFYVQVDNSKLVELSTTKMSDMKYEYKLEGYNKSGKKKTLTFKTSRKLKENAYLKLIVRSTGVYKWEEVELEDIPVKASEKLKI